MSPTHPVQSATDQPSLEERRQTFGTSLRCLREERGVSVASLSQTTRISVAFITALEAGQLDKLPGQVFGRGFVRSITKSYGYNGDDLVEAFERLWDVETPRSVLKVQIKSKPVRVRSEAMASFIHNTKSLVRRGILVKVAVPALFAVAALYSLVMSNSVHRFIGHLLDRNGATSLSAAKPLRLQEIAPPPEAATASEAVILAGPHASGTAGPSTGAASSDPLPPPTGESLAALPAADQPGKDAKSDEAAAEAHHEVAEAPTAAPSEQVLELTVSEPVRIRMDVDKATGVTKELRPDTYRLTFNQQADMLIYNASAVKIAFNGRQLGSLGSKGRVRRVSFQAQLPKAKKL